MAKPGKSNQNSQARSEGTKAAQATCYTTSGPSGTAAGRASKGSSPSIQVNAGVKSPKAIKAGTPRNGGSITQARNPIRHTRGGPGGSL